jgi:hypothetical protein
VICVTQRVLGGGITRAGLREQRFHVSHGSDELWRRYQFAGLNEVDPTNGSEKRAKPCV